MKLSGRVGRARESGTARIAGIARRLAAEGRTIFNLSVGEPDFDTPDFVIEAARRAMLGGATRYTDVAGTIELREAVAGKFRTENSIECGAGDVIVGTGAKQLIFNAMLATLDPGDEVIIPAPSWVSYPDMALIGEGRPVVVPCGAEAGFKIGAEGLERAITPRSRWLILNSPGNPTGAVYGAGELGELASVLRRHPRVAVISDDIYERILFGGGGFATLAGVAPDLAGRVLTVNGVSKSMAMTGWRIGYATGPADLIGAMAKLQGQSTTCASSIGQAAALAALRDPSAAEEFIGGCNAEYRRRRDLVRSALSGVEGLKLGVPEGAFYHFVDCRGLYGRHTPEGSLVNDDGDVCEHLLASQGVALVPGREFGGPGFFRLSYATSADTLEEACRRIRAGVEELR